uniref:WIZ zinc finger a n=1 Tax=Esox lucius TaxID=8010 RepID=A0A3P8ZAG3_ESOLU
KQASYQGFMCEVCGTYFETRRGLSSHARLHLRQLGVAVSDNSGAPIDLLYQLIQDRDGSMRPPKPVFSSPKKPKEPGSLAPRKDSPTGGKVKVVTTPQKNAPPGTTGPTARKGTVLAKPRQPSGSPFLAADKTPAPPAVSSLSSAKPAWAPQETDAPLTLAMDSNDEVHVCQLCGAWYESRKGLASHCRAHLRQFGITDNTEDKGGPIEFLYQVMEAEDLKPIASEGLNVYNPSVSSPSTKRPPSASPAKHRGLVKGDHPSSPQIRPSGQQRHYRFVFCLFFRVRICHSRVPLADKKHVASGCLIRDLVCIPGDFRCVLCGEEFENRKGLASHSRSHLRQLGITDLLGKASAIDTVQQLVSSGVLAAAASVRAGAAKVPSPAPPGSPPTSPAASHLSPPMSSHVQNPRPKARKGSTLVRPKPEPMEMEVDLEFSSPLEGYRSSNGSTLSVVTCASNVVSALLFSGQELMVPCDFCGQSFDSRKALSCHARSHLRQLGVTWSVNESPITLLQDIMQKGGSASSTEVCDLGRQRLVSGETCCELCGFDFENRTALASHARAHLRQLGVKEWRTEGVKASPIEMLTAWIQRQPRKAAEIHRQYRVGDLNVRFKVCTSVPCASQSAHSGSPSAGSAHSGAQRTAAPGLQLGHRAGREAPCASARTSQGSQGDRRYAAADASMPGSRGDLVRSPRGLERRFPKHGGHAEGAEGDRGSQQHSRSGNIPSLVPRPPSTPLVKQMGRQYTLKCRFCDALFLGSQSVQEDWIRHLQKHILDLSFNKPLGLSAAPPATAPVLLAPVAV